MGTEACAEVEVDGRAGDEVRRPVGNEDDEVPEDRGTGGANRRPEEGRGEAVEGARHNGAGRKAASAG